MSSYLTIEKINKCKSELQQIVLNGINQKTQIEILNLGGNCIIETINFLPKKEQTKILHSSLYNYFKGCFDVSIKNKTVFLYNLNGKFYKTKSADFIENAKIKALPKWDKLPVEKWGKLADQGALYWIDTLKPF